jgi:hypothetical protein
MSMTRAEITRQILTWEAVATRAQAVAAELRTQLADAARKELVEQGTAPTWRMPDLAVVTLPVSKPAVVVADQVALTQWAANHRPDEVELAIRPASLKALLRQVEADGDVVYLPGDGEIVPGLEPSPGGQPKSLMIRADPAGAAQIGADADDIMTAIAAALAEPAGIDNP